MKCAKSFKKKLSESSNSKYSINNNIIRILLDRVCVKIKHIYISYIFMIEIKTLYTPNAIYYLK